MPEFLFPCGLGVLNLKLPFTVVREEERRPPSASADVARDPSTPLAWSVHGIAL